MENERNGIQLVQAFNADDENGRRILLKILESNGDRSMCDQRSRKLIYIMARMELDRIFETPGAHGFLSDMFDFVLFSREHMEKTCCYVTAATCISYCLQAFGHVIPPIDVSKFVRHTLRVSHIAMYALGDDGGNSSVIFRLVERPFYNYAKQNRTCTTVCSDDWILEMEIGVMKKFLETVPLLGATIFPDN